MQQLVKMQHSTTTTGIDTPLQGLAAIYPDDLISQALGLWFALAQGCGLVDWYQLEEMALGERIAIAEEKP